MPTEKKWTVFFLAKSIGSGDTKELIGLLLEIEDILFEPDVNVVLCINFNRNYLDGLLKLNKELVLPNIDTDFTTMFFKLVQDGETGKNRLCCIGEKQGFDITSANDVSHYFKKYVLDKNQANRYLLFTWDHGNGFDIFHGIGRGGEVTDSDKTIPILEMEELSSAIKNAFGGEKIDLLIMMNCYMQMFDTAFTLCEQVSYLVAPLSYMTFGQYNYKDIFNKLAENAKDDLSGERLGEFVIESFKNNPPSSNLAISCLNLTPPDDTYEFANKLDDLADLLIERIKIGYSNEIACFFREAKPTRTQERFVDLGSVLDNMINSNCSSNHENEIVWSEKEYQVLEQLLDRLKYLIVAYYQKNGDNGNYSKDSWHGISIVSPVPVKVHSRLKNMDQLELHIWNSIFMNDRRWGELIYVLDILD